VLGLEVSRLARNNADWYRLLDLCGVTDTVIGDADGIYHPGSFRPSTRSAATVKSSPSTGSSPVASSADWEQALGALAEAQAELALREQQQPRTLTDAEREQLLALGADLGRVWAAPSTTDRDRKQLIRTLIEE